MSFKWLFIPLVHGISSVESDGVRESYTNGGPTTADSWQSNLVRHRTKPRMCFPLRRVIQNIDQSEFEGFEYVNPLLMSMEDCV